MADGGVQDVLGLKARAAQKAVEARGMSTAKALRRALAKAADDAFDLSLVCNGVALEVLDQDGVIDALSPDALVLLLDGPGGVVGLAQTDRALLAGLTEIQTIQTVTSLPPETRPLTPTDAAMMAPLIDGAMGRFSSNLDDNPLQGQLSGFRFGAMVEDARAAALILDASSYRTFHVEIDLAGGKRSGTLSFFLPERVLEEPVEEGAESLPGPHEEMLLEVAARLDCVLARMTLPLARVEAMTAGDILPLPAMALDSVELVAGGGPVVARGRLGQLNGARAVRLNWPKGLDGGETARPGGAERAPQQDAAHLFEAPDTGSPEPEAEPEPFGLDAMMSDMDDLPDLPPLDPEPADDGGLDAAFGMGGADDGSGGDTDFDADFGGGFAAAPLDLGKDD